MVLPHVFLCVSIKICPAVQRLCLFPSVFSFSGIPNAYRHVAHGTSCFGPMLESKADIKRSVHLNGLEHKYVYWMSVGFFCVKETE